MKYWKPQIWYPLVICYITNWKMAIEIVDLPINSMVIFQFAMLVYQKVVRFFFQIIMNPIAKLELCV